MGKIGKIVYIIAEIGVNFRTIDEAKCMISTAMMSGADAVKFQVYDQDNLYKCYPNGETMRNLHYEDLMDIRLDQERLKELKKHADSEGINMFATPMYLDAVDMLEEIGVDRYKIRFDDRDNNELLDRVFETGKPVMISCDQKYLNKLSDTILLIDKDVDFMFCIPEYPPTTVYFKPFLDYTFTGYSNHYPSIVPPFIAAARGCQILEVHVKLDGTVPIDNDVSISFSDLKQLVYMVREMEDVISWVQF